MFKHFIFLGVLFLLSCSASEQDLYKVLGVERSSSQAEIKRAYKTLAKEWYDYFAYCVNFKDVIYSSTWTGSAAETLSSCRQ